MTAPPCPHPPDVHPTEFPQNGETAVHMAARKWQWDVVELLIEKGADVMPANNEVVCFHPSTLLPLTLTHHTLPPESPSERYHSTVGSLTMLSYLRGEAVAGKGCRRVCNKQCELCLKVLTLL